MKQLRTTNGGRRGWLRGFAAGLAGVGAAEAMAAAVRSRSFLDAAGQLVVDSGPRSLVERVVRMLKESDKPVIRGSVVGVVLTIGGLVGRARRHPVRDVAVVLGAAGVGVALSRRRASEDGPADGGVATAGMAVGTGVLATVAAMSASRAGVSAAGAGGGVALAAAIAVQARRRRRQDQRAGDRVLRAARPLLPAVDGAEGWPEATPLLTPVDRFYVTDVNMRPPLVDLDTWRLEVSGGRTPLSLGYDDLLGFDLVEFDAVMVCVHNRLGWSRLGNARWTGVPVSDLLAAAGPTPDSAFLVSRAVDGWECSMPLSVLAELDARVVVGMGGKPLTAAHGFPARLFVPGLYGQYTGAKWLAELRLQDVPNADYWLPRGWARGPVRVRPLSRIDAPKHNARLATGRVEVTGVAWAPPGGVRSVQVAVDDRPWMEAELAAELAPTSWRRWRARVDLEPGRHEVRVRCVAVDGTPQDSAPRPPFPTGVSGHHTIGVTVR